MRLSKLSQIVAEAFVEYGDIPVVENSNYWMNVTEPRHSSFKVGVPGEAEPGDEYFTPCFIIEVGC
jgi:hypothetical protein